MNNLYKELSAKIMHEHYWTNLSEVRHGLPFLDLCEEIAKPVKDYLCCLGWFAECNKDVKTENGHYASFNADTEVYFRLALNFVNLIGSGGSFFETEKDRKFWKNAWNNKEIDMKECCYMQIDEIKEHKKKCLDAIIAMCEGEKMELEETSYVIEEEITGTTRE